MAIRCSLLMLFLAACTAGQPDDPETAQVQESINGSKPVRDAGPVDAAPLTAAEAARREMEPVNPAAYYARQEFEPRAPSDECGTIHTP